MVGRDICVIYGYLYLNVSLSPHLHTSTSPYLSLSLYIHTYIYIYVCIIIVYIYLHNQYIYVSILDKKPILSIIYIKNAYHGKAGVVTRLSTTKRAKNHWDQPRTWWLRWGLASNPRRCAGCFWSFAWGHSYSNWIKLVWYTYIYIYIHHLIWDIGTFLFIIFYTYSHLSVQALPQL